MLHPEPDKFRQLARGGRLVPVYAEILADLETPVSAYWKIASGATHSFLLESVTGGERLARYSFLGADPRLVVRSRGRTGYVTGDDGREPFDIPEGDSPLGKLKEIVAEREYAPVEGLPRFTGGAVGILSYDMVRFFEQLPDDTHDDLMCEDMIMLIADTLLAFDHARNRILVISHATDQEGSYEEAHARIESLIEKLRAPLPTMPEPTGAKPQFESNMSRDAYERAVRETKEYIVAGDGVQMVISQRFSAKVDAHPIMMYRSLRSLNPSPYMYLLRFGDCDVIGASPEILVTFEDGLARVRPIAGTRPRGATEQEDRRLEQELLADEKERAEHIMLVDLGRNDIGRVSEPGTVKVNELMTIERYSHVMHIVSDVTGRVRPEYDAFDVLQACFPAGTVSGAPKVRAMEIIEEFEPTRRGCYAGAAGYFGFNGDMDMAISIRTIFLKDCVAHIQAGAGIVYDSVPENEWQECHSKAAALIKAVGEAEGGMTG
ncbi:MAG: anthranilate synthase component I [Armatimonadetes bacterium]|nr:anthranilate synthase component I [Armatimonadota bacterium]